MVLVKGIKERRSIRKFQNKPVPHELLTEVVEIARFAPSWKNTQIARYIIVEDREKIAKIATEECTLGFTYNIKTMAAAPACLLLIVSARLICPFHFLGFSNKSIMRCISGLRW